MFSSMIRKAGGAVIFFALTWAAPAWASGDDFVIGTARVPGGSSFSGALNVSAKDGVGTEIPFTVLHGVQPGPVLALNAGIHGYEYPPILALYRLKDAIDPKTLRGTVLLVHIANLPSFKRRTLHGSPDDWKNLNLVFPGDLDGSVTQRIAAVLDKEIIQRADVLVDMHCGDGNEALIPHTYWMLSGDKAFDAKTRDLALAFGLPHIIIYDTAPKVLAGSKYFDNTAILRRKLAITTEVGCLGRTDEGFIAMNVRGALSVMRHLGMIDGKPEPSTDPVWIDKYEIVRSKWNGLFAPRVEMGAYVRQGQVVGTVTDYLGQWKEDVKAPFTGILLYVVGTPPCNDGEPLFEVGRVQEK